MQVPSSLSLVPIPRRKGKVVPTAFNVDKVIEDEEVPGPAPVWQPKIAGREDLVTPPPAKRSKHEQQRKVVRAVDSDLGEEASGKSKIGRRKLVLEARSASQPAPAKDAESMAAEDASASSQPVTEVDLSSEGYLKAFRMLQALSDKELAAKKSARSTRSASQKAASAKTEKRTRKGKDKPNDKA